MSKARFLPAIVLALAICAFPAGAGAEAIVPPGNSAAAQYTEAFPTAGGEKETGDSGKKKPTPGKVLGERNSHKLESKGSEGKAVAEFAAETAPAPAATPVPQGGGESPSAGGGNTKAQGQKADSGNQNGEKGNGGENSSPAAAAAGGGQGGSGTAAAQPAGSSGLGEVIGQATGSSSSGKLGLLLPLIVIAAVIWSLFYFWRQRQRVA
jgi:hypothetical protein